MSTRHPRAAQAVYHAQHDPASPTITIYKVIFLPEKRPVYTGRTQDPRRRITEHGAPSSGCRLMRDAIRRHGADKFEIVPVLRCASEDADANESHFIQALETMYPNGYNLRHGAMAGVAATETRVAVPPDGTVVVFAGAADEFQARGEANAAFAELCKDTAESAEEKCNQILRRVHPDRAGARVFTAEEVTAMVNDLRSAARRERPAAPPPRRKKKRTAEPAEEVVRPAAASSRSGRARSAPRPFWETGVLSSVAADEAETDTPWCGGSRKCSAGDDEEATVSRKRQPQLQPNLCQQTHQCNNPVCSRTASTFPSRKGRCERCAKYVRRNNGKEWSNEVEVGANQWTSVVADDEEGDEERVERVASTLMCVVCEELPAATQKHWMPCFGQQRCARCGKYWYRTKQERPIETRRGSNQFKL